jgi:hypothetical protein
MQLPGGDRLVRPAAYTIGFFVFWALGALSSGLTLYFSQTATSLPPPDPDAP